MILRITNSEEAQKQLTNPRLALRRANDPRLAPERTRGLTRVSPLDFIYSYLDQG